MAKSSKPATPYSAVLGTGERNQVAGTGTKVTRTTMPQPKGTKSGSKSPGVHRLPGAGNW